MKRLGTLTCVAVTLMAALALTVPLAAQEQPQTHYTIQDLGNTLGGTFSWASGGINNKGWITGFAGLPGDTVGHAVLWRKGVITDLGTLGGLNSTPGWGLNERGWVTGAAETSTPDPFNENCWGIFGGTDTGLTCAPFLWRDGVMTALPTLGGNNGFATSVNNRGYVVGSTENSTPAGDSCGEFIFQAKPVIWKHGQIEELPTLSGDVFGNAIDINDLGQVVGWTRPTDCTAQHPVLWEKGMVTYLGNLGGTFGWAFGINNQGQAVGRSFVSGDVAFQHGFLWQRDAGMKDLETLPGDSFSAAYIIDNKGRVGGTSCDASFNCRAFLWQDGIMTDLNTLIPADSQWYLLETDGINSRGEIIGGAFNLMTGEIHAFLATPTASSAASDLLTGRRNDRARPKVVLPENVRKLLQQRHGNRFGVGLKRPQ